MGDVMKAWIGMFFRDSLEALIDYRKEREQYFKCTSRCLEMQVRNRTQWSLRGTKDSPGEMQTSLSSLSIQQGEAIVNCS